MKRFFTILTIMFFTTAQCFAEQYLLHCPMSIQTINTATGEIMTKSTIQRYFIIDTILGYVFDSDNVPLTVDGFTDDEISFRHKAQNFNTVVETKIVYNRLTKQMKLVEIYGNNAYSMRAQFATKGEAICTEKQIERQPIFY